MNTRRFLGLAALTLGTAACVGQPSYDVQKTTVAVEKKTSVTGVEKAETTFVTKVDSIKYFPISLPTQCSRIVNRTVALDPHSGLVSAMVNCFDGSDQEHFYIRCVPSPADNCSGSSLQHWTDYRFDDSKRSNTILDDVKKKP